MTKELREKITHPTYVGIEGSYKSFEIALFDGEHCVDSIVGGKTRASSEILLHFKKLLENNNRIFNDLDFIALDQGPGAFTSLRVLISTVNGLAFSRSTDLVGIDGLDALASQTKDLLGKELLLKRKPLIISLLNAYNNEVYYGVYEASGQDSVSCMPKGYKKIDLFLEELSAKAQGRSLIFMGNGVEVGRDLIQQKFSNQLIGSVPLLLTCSAEQVGRMGLHQWQNNPNRTSELFPLYLKTQSFAIKK